MQNNDAWKLIDHARDLGYIDPSEAKAIKRITTNFIQGGPEVLNAPASPEHSEKKTAIHTDLVISRPHVMMECIHAERRC